MLYGDGIQWLTLRREGIEKSLQELQTLKKASGLHLCGISPEELGVSSEEEVLQTMVVSLDDVRKNIDDWKSAMWDEYKSLTEETRAIEPVDASVLENQGRGTGAGKTCVYPQGWTPRR